MIIIRYNKRRYYTNELYRIYSIPGNHPFQFFNYAKHKVNVEKERVRLVYSERQGNKRYMKYIMQ